MKMQISNSAYHENTTQGDVVPAPPPSGSLSMRTHCGYKADDGTHLLSLSEITASAVIFFFYLTENLTLRRHETALPL